MRSFIAVLIVVGILPHFAAGQDGVPLEESRLDSRLRALWRSTDNIEAQAFVREIERLDLTAERRLEVMMQILDHPAELARSEAIKQIGQLREAARSATPRLLQIARNGATNRGEAVAALREVSLPTPEVIDGLLAAAIDEKGNGVHTGVLDLLRYWGPKAQAAVPLLESLQDHESVEVQIHAFEALGRITNLSRPSLAELKEIDFPSLTPAQAHAALASIQDFGFEAAFVAPRLKDWHSLPNTRPSVKLAILAVYPALIINDRWYIPELFAAWREHEDSGAARYSVGRAISGLSGRNSDAVPLLIAELTRPSDETSGMAAMVLAKGGARALPADSALAPLLEWVDGTSGTPNNQRLGNYLELVRAMGPHAQLSRAALVKLLERYLALSTDDVQARGISSFLFIVLADGPMPREALPLVLDALQSPERAWPWAAAARAAGALGPAATEAVPLLVSALQIPPNYHVTIRVERFGMGPGHVNGDFTTIRLEAIRALGKIGPAASAALPILQSIAGYQSPDFSRTKDSGYEGLENATHFVVPRLEAAAARAAIDAIAPTRAK